MSTIEDMLGRSDQADDITCLTCLTHLYANEY